MGAFLSFLKRQRLLVEGNLARKRKSHTFSLVRYLLHKRLALLIKTYVDGVCLDAGSGHSPFKESLSAVATRVVTVDSENRSGEVDFVADIQNMHFPNCVSAKKHPPDYCISDNDCGQQDRFS